MILVTGAAGKTGKAVVKALAAKGARVRALVRDPEHAAALMALGAAEVCLGSFDDARALRALRPVCRRSITSARMSAATNCAYARAVAAAAQAQNVTRFVYHSVLHPQIEAMPHHWQKMRTEEMLFAGRLRSDHPATDRLHAKYSRRVARRRRRRRVSCSLSGRDQAEPSGPGRCR